MNEQKLKFQSKRNYSLNLVYLSGHLPGASYLIVGEYHTDQVARTLLNIWSAILFERLCRIFERTMVDISCHSFKKPPILPYSQDWL